MEKCYGADCPALLPVLFHSAMQHNFRAVTYNSLWCDCEGGAGAKTALEKDLLSVTSDASKAFSFKHWTTINQHMISLGEACESNLNAANLHVPWSSANIHMWY